jgi:serine/threonine protein kinase
MLTSKPPYSNESPLDAMGQILKESFPPFPSNISEELRDFLQYCFKKNPKDRASISDLLAHPWIGSLARYKDRGSSKNLQTLLHSLDGTTQFYGNDFVKQQELTQMALSRTTEILTTLQKNSQLVSMNPENMDMDTLRKRFCDLQAENRVLAVISAKIQQTLNANSQQLQESLSKKICKLEDFYITGHSDLKLAKLIISKNLPMSQFATDVRGVLLMKRGK